MSTVDEEHKPSHTLGHVLMGLVAFALATAAVYLWITDNGRPFSLSLPFAGPSSVAPAPVQPEAGPGDRSAPPERIAPPSPPRPTKTVAQLTGSPPSAGPPAPISRPAPSPAPLNGEVDPQVASDAAATGMTARARPAPPANP